MPSKLSKRTSSRSSSPAVGRSVNHLAFVPLLAVCLIVWVVYRLLFRFPVWFDETLGKAIFFGLPVWLYISMTGNQDIANTFAPSKIRPGLLLGIAVGGLYGFAVSLLRMLQPGTIVSAVPLFSSPDFWGEFILAICTGFWETLFFYSWIMLVVEKKLSKKSIFLQIVMVAAIFVVFHIPNMVLRTGWSSVMYLVPLLFLFAIGQALLFLRNRNAYALVLSQAIWGLVLLVHLN